jgi:hypothetical protein
VVFVVVEVVDMDDLDVIRFVAMDDISLTSLARAGARQK